MLGFYQPSEDDFDPATDDLYSPYVAVERKYLHFDRPLKSADAPRQLGGAGKSNPHRFLPLLGYVQTTRRYKVSPSGLKKPAVKERPIRFAGHSDSSFLHAYGHELGRVYERFLQKSNLSDIVLAYRKGGATNIHHAKAFFEEIVNRRDCVVIALDISGFFDCLDHRLMKTALEEVLEQRLLHSNHFLVWRNVTKYSWVETSELKEMLEGRTPSDGMICSNEDFRQIVRGRKEGLVRTNLGGVGIPQGTPVSGLYANIYMANFDCEMKRLLHRHGGSYRRYSDDIALIVPKGKVRHFVALVEKILADYQLTLSVEKTEWAEFSGGSLESKRPIQYLGFTFDGKSILLRPSSLDAYRAKMQRGIHAKLIAAKKKGVPSSKVYKRELISRYTHMGKGRNFIQYAYRAADIMESAAIRSQVAHHVTWFNDAWRREVKKVYGGLVCS